MGDRLTDPPGAVFILQEGEWKEVIYTNQVAIGGNITRYRYSIDGGEVPSQAWEFGKNLLFLTINAAVPDYGGEVDIGPQTDVTNFSQTIEVVPLDSDLNQISIEGTPQKILEFPVTLNNNTVFHVWGFFQQFNTYQNVVPVKHTYTGPLFGVGVGYYNVITPRVRRVFGPIPKQAASGEPDESTVPGS